MGQGPPGSDRKASASSLQECVKANIAPGSTVATDAWGSYPTALTGYDHQPLNVSASGRPAHESLPAVHRLFSLLRREVEGTSQGAGTAEHLPEYLDEFEFRFNRHHSHNRVLVFMRLLQRVVGSDPVKYRTMIRVPRPKQSPPTGVTGSRTQPGSLDAPVAARPWQQ